MIKKTLALGVMSGTSLDGLDMALCAFSKTKHRWRYEILEAETLSYDDHLKNQLSEAAGLSGAELTELDKAYGRYTGKKMKDFLEKHNAKVDFIASHGHTVFHQPEKKLTLQIGDGNEIAAVTGVKVIHDFRSLDIAKGGQGAPLVPIGDRLLFAAHDYCLNLGGIANISYDENNARKAFDICPANMALNFLAAKTGMEYDQEGQTAKKGKIIPALRKALDNLDYYRTAPPKSLGKEWFDNNFIPLVNKVNYNIEDIMHTVTEHIALQVSRTIKKEGGSMLVTGGGAFNSFLMEKLRAHAQKTEVVVPENKLVEYKEALVFAFLGTLRMQEETNCLSSVTGAREDSISGSLIIP